MPCAASGAPECPGVARDAEAEIDEDRARHPICPSLSASRTDTNAAPFNGKRVAGAELALGKTPWRKSRSMPITSPVERISGPRMGSTPGKKRANGKHRLLHGHMAELFATSARRRRAALRS